MNRLPEPSIFSRRDILKVAGFGSFVAAAVYEFTVGGLVFEDVPIPDKNDFGRTVNASSAVIVGIISQKIAPNKNIEAIIKKPGWSDARLTGTTTNNTIETAVELNLTSSKFSAQGNGEQINGKVDKSEFDWEVKSRSVNTWEIGRFGLKFDHTLMLTASDGLISGRLYRTAGFNWDISGTYTNDSFNIQVETGRLSPNFEITGTFK
jgi:hypothetical protein